MLCIDKSISPNYRKWKQSIVLIYFQVICILCNSYNSITDFQMQRLYNCTIDIGKEFLSVTQKGVLFCGKGERMSLCNNMKSIHIDCPLTVS